MALSITLSCSASPIAFANQATCDSKALSKDGKPLYGAAKSTSIKKCGGGA